MFQSNNKTGLVSSDRFREHDTGPGHPERSGRVPAIMAALDNAGLLKAVTRIDPRAATEREVLRCHTPGYWATARRDVESGLNNLSTGDTAICPKSLEVALLAAGGVLEAVDAVVKGRISNAFCVVRPPGHHATPDRGMGFCLFNNISLGARHAQTTHGIGKVLIVDWDVHHGNGTQDVFYSDGSVMVFNTHQSPLYPGTGDPGETGEGKGKGCIINCPFRAGAGRKEILGAFQDRLVPAADAFKPELVMISAGFDSRIEDPLGGFRLVDQDFADLTELMLSVARRHAGGRLVSVLEGGYNLDGLGKAAAAHLGALVKAP